MINLFRRMFGRDITVEKSAGATLYPDKIVIVTRYKRDKYPWYHTDNLTLLPPDVDNRVLGETLLHHIHQSKVEPASAEEMKSIDAKYLVKANFKSEKQTMVNARYLSIYLTKKMIRMEPFQNKKSQQSFWRIPDAIVNIDSNVEAESIGRHMRLFLGKMQIRGLTIFI